MKTYALAKSTILTNDWRLLPYVRLVSNYLASLEAGNEHSYRASRSDLNFWLAYLAKVVGPFMQILLGEVSAEHASAFPEYRLKQGDSPATVNRRLATLKSFDKFIANNCSEYRQIFYKVKGPRVEQENFEGLSAAEASALIAAAYKLGDTDFANRRNGFACAFILATGIRAAEALRVTESQIKGRWISNLRCKGAFYRDVHVPKHLLDNDYPEYLDARRKELGRRGIQKTASLPLLISDKTLAMSYKTLWRIIASAAAKAKIGHVRPHQLRHTRAHEILHSTNDIRLVAQALGHQSLDTTMRYTSRSKEQLAKALDNAR